MSVIFPKMAGKEDNDLLSKYDIHELSLPLIKYNKIYYASKILELDSLGIKNEQVRPGEDVIKLLYNIINNAWASPQGFTLEQYKKEMKLKLTKSNIIEDIV